MSFKQWALVAKVLILRSMLSHVDIAKATGYNTIGQRCDKL